MISRTLFGVLSVVISGLMLSVAASTLRNAITSTDTVGLAKVIEGNSVYRQQLIARDKPLDQSAWVDSVLLERVIASDSFRIAIEACLNEGSRASVSDTAGAFDQNVLTEAPDGAARKALALAAATTKQRLKCSPVDGNAWALLSHLKFLAADQAEIDPILLDLSYYFAPSEKWIMAPRIRFVDYLTDRRLMASPPGHSVDLQSFIDLSGTAEIAALYADSGTTSRSVMRKVIDGQRLNRRLQILRHIDALGVDYPVPEKCRQQRPKDAPPGFELDVRRPADLIAACEK